jgi:hypothetical protein
MMKRLSSAPSALHAEAVVLQPNARIDFAVILDNIIGRSKTLRETRVTHGAPECLGPWPLGAKAAPFLIVAPTVMWVAVTP